MSADFKKLYRSATEKKLVGVCGGLGVFFHIDPVFVRLAWVAVTLMTGIMPGILAYLIAWFLVPKEPTPVVTAQIHHAENNPA